MKERIKAIRKRSGLNQTDFGSRIGATQAMLTSYETGRVIPPEPTLKLICKEFNISYAWLKTGEGPMEDPSSDLDTVAKLSGVYQNLPDRLKTLVDVLADMDPEWWKTLDDAFAELERRRNEKGDAD